MSSSDRTPSDALQRTDLPPQGAGRGAGAAAVALGSLLGAVGFLCIGGWRVLDPHEVNWLLVTPDAATHYLGWQFFRHGPWSWPPGLNPGYGLEVSSSIVYSDSVPLMALLFKPFSPWLGPTFQYSGIWLLLCFILQGVFAMLLMGRLTERLPLRSARTAAGTPQGPRIGPAAAALLLQGLAAAFLVLAPVLLVRARGHYALTAQWLILWAIYLYLNDSPLRPRPRYVWAIPAMLGATVHLYFTAMVLGIWQADVLRRCLRRRSESLDHRSIEPLARKHADPQGNPLLREYPVVLAATLLTMWAAGYFAVPFADSFGPGFGYYSLNLLALVDPRGGSRFLPDLPLAIVGQYEGSCYLGLGLILLTVLAAYAVVRRPASHAGPLPTRPPLLPLLALCGLLTLFALSATITLGPWKLLLLPDFSLGLGKVFRASGRMFWPAFYALVLGLLWLVLSRWRPRTSACLLAALLVVQVLDLQPLLSLARQHLNHVPPPPSPLQDAFWLSAARRYKRILLVPTQYHGPQWFALARLAADHGLALNTGYFARPSQTLLDRANQSLLQSLRTGRLDPDALYVIADDNLLPQLTLLLPPDARVAQVDGFTIIAPHWPPNDAMAQ